MGKIDIKPTPKEKTEQVLSEYYGKETARKIVSGEKTTPQVKVSVGGSTYYAGKPKTVVEFPEDRTIGGTQTTEGQRIMPGSSEYREQKEQMTTEDIAAKIRAREIEARGVSSTIYETYTDGSRVPVRVGKTDIVYVDEGNRSTPYQSYAKEKYEEKISRPREKPEFYDQFMGGILKEDTTIEPPSDFIDFIRRSQLGAPFLHTPRENIENLRAFGRGLTSPSATLAAAPEIIENPQKIPESLSQEPARFMKNPSAYMAEFAGSGIAFDAIGRFLKLPSPIVNVERTPKYPELSNIANKVSKASTFKEFGDRVYLYGKKSMIPAVDRPPKGMKTFFIDTTSYFRKPYERVIGWVPKKSYKMSLQTRRTLSFSFKPKEYNARFLKGVEKTSTFERIVGKTPERADLSMSFDVAESKYMKTMDTRTIKNQMKQLDEYMYATFQRTKKADYMGRGRLRFITEKRRVIGKPKEPPELIDFFVRERVNIGYYKGRGGRADILQYRKTSVPIEFKTPKDGFKVTRWVIDEKEMTKKLKSLGRKGELPFGDWKYVSQELNADNFRFDFIKPPKSRGTGKYVPIVGKRTPRQSQIPATQTDILIDFDEIVSPGAVPIKIPKISEDQVPFFADVQNFGYVQKHPIKQSRLQNAKIKTVSQNEIINQKISDFQLKAINTKFIEKSPQKQDIKFTERIEQKDILIPKIRFPPKPASFKPPLMFPEDNRKYRRKRKGRKRKQKQRLRVFPVLDLKLG